MDIDDFLGNGIDMFEQEVAARYADQEYAAKVWSLADHVAQLVHRDVQSIGASKQDSSWREIREILSELDVKEDLDFALQARLAWRLRPSFSEAAKRCWDLAALIRRTEAPDSVQRFLARVTRCYLLDFVPECIVMCRAALENGVNARYAAAKVPFPTDAKGLSGMKIRLQGAEERGWLEPGTANALYSEVWMRGSKAAHGDPVAVGDALGTITLTIHALSTLNPPDLPE